MELLTKIQGLCKAQGISVHKLEMELGFGNRAIYKWNSISPSIDKVIAVANYFGVSLDALTERDCKNELLTAKEKELLEAFRSMNEQGQLALLSAAEGFASTGIYKKCDMAKEEA